MEVVDCMYGSFQQIGKFLSAVGESEPLEDILPARKPKAPKEIKEGEYTLLDLPQEVLIEMFLFLGPDDLLPSTRVNKEIRMIASMDYIWKEMFMRIEGRRSQRKFGNDKLGSILFRRRKRKKKKKVVLTVEESEVEVKDYPKKIVLPVKSNFFDHYIKKEVYPRHKKLVRKKKMVGYQKKKDAVEYTQTWCKGTALISLLFFFCSILACFSVFALFVRRKSDSSGIIDGTSGLNWLYVLIPAGISVFLYICTSLTYCMDYCMCEAAKNVYEDMECSMREKRGYRYFRVEKDVHVGSEVMHLIIVGFAFIPLFFIGTIFHGLLQAYSAMAFVCYSLNFLFFLLLFCSPCILCSKIWMLGKFYKGNSVKFAAEGYKKDDYCTAIAGYYGVLFLVILGNFLFIVELVLFLLYDIGVIADFPGVSAVLLSPVLIVVGLIVFILCGACCLGCCYIVTSCDIFACTYLIAAWTLFICVIGPLITFIVLFCLQLEGQMDGSLFFSFIPAIVFVCCVCCFYPSVICCYVRLQSPCS